MAHRRAEAVFGGVVPLRRRGRGEGPRDVVEEERAPGEAQRGVVAVEPFQQLAQRLGLPAQLAAHRRRRVFGDRPQDVADLGREFLLVVEAVPERRVDDRRAEDRVPVVGADRGGRGSQRFRELRVPPGRRLLEGERRFLQRLVVQRLPARVERRPRLLRRGEIGAVDGEEQVAQLLDDPPLRLAAAQVLEQFEEVVDGPRVAGLGQQQPDRLAAQLLVLRPALVDHRRRRRQPQLPAEAAGEAREPAVERADGDAVEAPQQGDEEIAAGAAVERLVAEVAGEGGALALVVRRGGEAAQHAVEDFPRGLARERRREDRLRRGAGAEQGDVAGRQLVRLPRAGRGADREEVLGRHRVPSFANAGRPGQRLRQIPGNESRSASMSGAGGQ